MIGSILFMVACLGIVVFAIVWAAPSPPKEPENEP